MKEKRTHPRIPSIRAESPHLFISKLLSECVTVVSLQVFHCVHFECPAQLDTEVTEGSPGLDSSDTGATSQQLRPQRPSRTHGLLPSQPSSSSSSSSPSHHWESPGPVGGRCWEEGRPQNAILHSLHHPDRTAKTPIASPSSSLVLLSEVQHYRLMYL